MGKSAVIGMKNRDSNRIVAKVIPDTKSVTLHKFIVENTSAKAKVITDEFRGYLGIPRDHEFVCHSVGEYVKDMAHTNGIESFWSMLERSIMGIFHHMSPKHLNRYVTEFMGRHNIREIDTKLQMGSLAKYMKGKRLTYAQLIA